MKRSQFFYAEINENAMETTLIFFEGKQRENLYPLTLTRPTADIRIGILTLREKWELLMNAHSSTLTSAYLQEVYPFHVANSNLLLNASLLPSPIIIEAIKKLQNGEALLHQDQLIALKLNREETLRFEKLIREENEKDFSAIVTSTKSMDQSEKNIRFLNRPSDIFSWNADEIAADYALLTQGRKSAEISKNNLLIGASDHLFVEEDVVMEGTIINTQGGPVYIGKGAAILEGAVLKGPLSIGEHSVVESCARVSNGTTVGPWCKVGGEIKNSVFLGYSNKVHDGFLGNAVIGEWCNIGAGSNFSNLQNNYKTVRQWHYPAQKFTDTGLQFCGIVMGDHNKCSIGSIFNTGTVVGVCCNLFGEGFHNRFIPSFSYGGKSSGYEENQIEKVIETAIFTQKRRNIEMKESEMNVLRYLFTHRKKLHL